MSALVTGFVASTIPEIKLLISGFSTHREKAFGDILYGVPIGESKIPTIAKMMTENSMLSPSLAIHVLIDHCEQVDAIERYCAMYGSSQNFRWTAFLKVDTGYHRAGVPDNEYGLEVALRIIKSYVIDLRGIYSHCGHAYDTNNPYIIREIAEVDLTKMRNFHDRIANHYDIGISDSDKIPLTISVGSTPTAFSIPRLYPISDHHKLSNEPIIEIHPGNYPFFDRQQQFTTVCPDENSVSCRILSRVIGHYPDRNTIMLDAGATALSKDTTAQGGLFAIEGYPQLECFKMSQEVSLVRLKRHDVDNNERTEFPFRDFPLGKIMGLVPNHSCLAAACFDKYYVVEEGGINGENEVIEEWIPAKGW